jgi:hypothetical protein
VATVLRVARLLRCMVILTTIPIFPKSIPITDVSSVVNTLNRAHLTKIGIVVTYSTSADYDRVYGF